MTFIIHTSGPVKIGTTVIGGVTNLDSALGSQVKGEASSGEVYARVQSLIHQRPGFSFSSEDLANLLTVFASGKEVSLASSAFVMYGSKLADGGRLAASNHLSITASQGLVLPKSLSCSHGGNASMSVEGHISSATDTTDPFTISTTATLATITALKHWTLSTATIGGVSIPQQLQIGLDFGLAIQAEAADSNVLASIVSVRASMPKLSIGTSLQGNLLSALLGVSGSFSIVLRQRKQGGTFDTGTITLSGSCLALEEKLFGVSGQGVAQKGLQGTILWDGTHDPITIAIA